MKKANNILVLFWKLFWPYEPLKNVSGTSEVKAILSTGTVGWRASHMSEETNRCGILRVYTLYLTLTQITFIKEARVWNVDKERKVLEHLKEDRDTKQAGLWAGTSRRKNLGSQDDVRKGGRPQLSAFFKVKAKYWGPTMCKRFALRPRDKKEQGRICSLQEPMNIQSSISFTQEETPKSNDNHRI